MSIKHPLSLVEFPLCIEIGKSSNVCPVTNVRLAGCVSIDWHKRSLSKMNHLSNSRAVDIVAFHHAVPYLGGHLHATLESKNSIKIVRSVYILPPPPLRPKLQETMVETSQNKQPFSSKMDQKIT